MKDDKNFDRNPKSKAYVPYDTKLKQMYFYGAFFGGRKDNLIEFCKTLREWQLYDTNELGYEPIYNDESYINAYFHYNPPHTVPSDKFVFLVSNKGGIREMRDANTLVDDLKEKLRKHRTDIIDIRKGDLIVEDKCLDPHAT
jgi:hypothetical protein